MNSIKNFVDAKDVFREMTLSQIVTVNYKAAAVFEKYSLDFCCKGNRAFNEVCKEKGIDAEEILVQIKNIDEKSSDNNMRFNTWELDFLVDYIINNHHQYVRESIPVIAAHADKVVVAHSKNHPELIGISKIFTMVYKELKQHLVKEEEILFPYIKNLVRVNQNLISYEKPYFGKIENPIKMMEVEHETAGDGMYDIRMITDNFTIPDDACNTFALFYNELKEFEEDLHKHVHIENNILFPKSINLEETILQNQNS